MRRPNRPLPPTGQGGDHNSAGDPVKSKAIRKREMRPILCRCMRVGLDRRRVDSQLAQLGRELFGPALVVVSSVDRSSSALGVLASALLAFLLRLLWRSSLGSFVADGQQIALGVVPSQPGRRLVPEKPVPDAKVDSERLDPVMAALVGCQPPISALSSR